MSIFGKIKDAIFGKKAAAKPAASPASAKPATAPAPAAAPAAQPQPRPQPKPAPAPAGAPTAAQAQPATAQAQPATAQAQPAAEVDVEAILEDLSAKSGQKLNWRTSIVDLMKLLGMESSLSERKELAQELGYTGALDGSAEMNTWLHKRVMRELAANGGRVPQSMLD
ncbi:MAG TPA: DUF3597 domain-containing protein [Pedomonas sp.]|uniref:DUF3597 domain-containing protein n=1 Tax=Pedomonas sp. TaxID=2976421 RepID=UPI002F3F2C0E